MYVRVKMDMLIRVYKAPNEKDIEKGLLATMAKQKLGDDINKSAYLLLVYYDRNKTTVKSENTVNAQWLMNHYMTSLESKGLVGIQLSRILQERIDKVVEDPFDNILPGDHNLTTYLLKNLIGKSRTRIPVEVYRNLMRHMENQGHQNKLTMIIHGHDDFRGS